MALHAEPAPLPTWWQRALIGRRPRRTLVRIAVLVVACILIRGFVLLPVQVEGSSMLPTYPDRGIHVVNRLAYRFREPRRGDVVAIRLLAGERVVYLKRVVGLPGETVAFHQGRLYVNGQPLDEPYVKLVGSWERESQQVGPDQYYVVGDNRAMPSWSDHTQGRASRQLIVGKVIL